MAAPRRPRVRAGVNITAEALFWRPPARGVIRPLNAGLSVLDAPAGVISDDCEAGKGAGHVPAAKDEGVGGTATPAPL